MRNHNFTKVTNFWSTILQHKAIFQVFFTTLLKDHIIAIVMMDTSVRRPIKRTVLILTNVLLDFTIAVWIRNVSIAQIIFNVRVKSATKWFEIDAQDRDRFMVLQCYLSSMIPQYRHKRMFDRWSQLFKARLLQWYWWQLWMCLPGWFRRWWNSVH